MKQYVVIIVIVISVSAIILVNYDRLIIIFDEPEPFCDTKECALESRRIGSSAQNTAKSLDEWLPDPPEHTAIIHELKIKQQDKYQNNIMIVPSLTNHGISPITINHGEDLFVLSIYDDDDNLIWKYPEHWFGYGFEYTLQPNIMYTGNFTHTVILNQTGNFTVESDAYYKIDGKPLQDHATSTIVIKNNE